jgi:hypothetical protein
MAPGGAVSYLELSTWQSISAGPSPLGGDGSIASPLEMVPIESQAMAVWEYGALFNSTAKESGGSEPF